MADQQKEPGILRELFNDNNIEQAKPKPLS